MATTHLTGVTEALGYLLKHTFDLFTFINTATIVTLN